MKEVNNITIEKYYNDNVAKIKNDIDENLINIKAIVVSVDQYQQYKFLIGEECKIYKVKKGEIDDITSIDEFINIDEFEANLFYGNSNGNNNENGENEKEPEKELEYKFEANESTKKGNVKLYNHKFSEDNKGIEFNGSSTYGTLELDELAFPMTIEATIKCNEKQGEVIFIDPKSKTAIGFDEYYFSLTVNNDVQTYKVPEDIYDGNLKNITVTYNSENDMSVYVNGIKQEKNGNKKSSLTSNIPSVAYVGSRKGKSFFNGILYNLRIYNKILDENEILSSYISDKDNIEKDTEQITRNDLIFDLYLNKIKDLSKNKKDLILYDESYTEEGKGAIFNGSSTYGQVNLENLTFPMTIEATIKCNKKQGEVIFIDPKSKTAIGFNEYYFSLTVNNDVQTYKVPEDLYDGNLKNIIVTYNSENDMSVYVNGIKQEKNGNQKSSLTSNIPSVAYIGSRKESSYFDGTIYDFTIYKGILKESQILNHYKNKLELYK